MHCVTKKIWKNIHVLNVKNRKRDYFGARSLERFAQVFAKILIEIT